MLLSIQVKQPRKWALPAVDAAVVVADAEPAVAADVVVDVAAQLQTHLARAS